MTEITVLDRTFIPYISEDKLKIRISEMAADVAQDYADKKPLFIALLNGSFMFAADVFRQLKLEAQITFVKLSSYEGTTTTGHVLTSIGLDELLQNRHVILLEDIIDTGKTMAALLPQLAAQQPASLEIASLLLKPAALQENIVPKYIGFNIPNNFVVGYGLDYGGYGRNLPSLYQLKP